MKNWAWLAIAIFLIFQLRYFNLAISYLDEGQLIYDAQRINLGQIPYRDFSLVLNPGTYYLQALALKIFGNYIITDRLLFIIVEILTIWIVSKTYPLTKNWQIIYLVLTGILAVWPGGFILYNFLGLLAIAASFYLHKKKMFFAAGVWAGIIFISKQTLGITVIPMLGLITLLSFNHKAINRWLFGLILTLGLFWTYFVINHALGPMIHYTLLFSAQAKSHSLDFIVHRVLFALPLIAGFWLWPKLPRKQKILFAGLGLLILLGYLGLKPSRFGRLWTYLPDWTFWLYSLYYLLPLYFISKRQNLAASLIALGTFLGITASGYSLDMIWFTSIIYLPLIIYWRPIANWFTAILIIVVAVSVSHAFANKIYNTYPIEGVNARSQISALKYLKLSPQENFDLEQVNKFVQTTTRPEDKIFCFPYCPIIYSLVNRQNVSKFSLFYFETFSRSDQQLVIDELTAGKPKLIILQKIGYIDVNPNSAYMQLPLIKNFITSHYHLAKSFTNFDIYQ